MPRPMTVALSAELVKPLTRMGYLLQINASEIRRWSTLGDVDYARGW